MSEKFTRKNFIQRVVGGLTALTLAKTEAKPVLNQAPAVATPPPTPPVKNFKDYGSYSGMYSCTGYHYSGIYCQETFEKYRSGKL